MTLNLSTFVVQINNLIPDIPTGNEVDNINIRQQVKQATIAYGRDFPETATTDLSGDGGKYYALSAANFPGWSDEFSHISAIQYPAPTVASDETPVYLNQEDWDQNYYAGGTRYLFLPSHAPASTETMRITYTSLYGWSAGSKTTSVNQVAHGFDVDDYVFENAAGLWVAAETADLLATHQVTTDTDTDNFIASELVVAIPTAHFFAVCLLAACLLCRAISTRYSRTNDSTIGADSVRHTSRAGEFSKRANEFCAAYAEALGIEGGAGGADGTGEQGHAEFVDLDTAPGWPSGRQFIFHGKETR